MLFLINLMRNIVYIVSLILSTVVVGQNINPLVNANSDILNGDLLDRKEYAAYKGSPFLLEDHTKGKIIFKSGDEREFEKLNLDLYKNLVLAVVDEKETALLNKYIKEIQLSSEGYGLRTFKVLVEKGEYVFYEELVRDNVKLMKRQLVRLKVEDKSNATSYSGNTEANQKRFAAESLYYWTQDYQSMNGFEPKKKELVSEFNMVSDLSQFLKAEKLNPKNEDDLVKIFDYINFKGI